MKVAIITDSHAGVRNDSEKFTEFSIKFFEEQFIPYLIEHNIKNVIHLGDIFDRRKFINFSTLYQWNTRVFSKLHSILDRMDILLGNHDTFFKNTNEVNSVSALLSTFCDKFNIYERAIDVNIGGLDILYVPWICDENRVHSVEMIRSSNSKVCMGHLEIIGFEMHAGHINTDIGFSQSEFSKFYHTFSGHFHHKSKSGNIQYLGSPYEMIWSDYNDPRGFHVFDTETLELEFIRNKSHIFIKLNYDENNLIEDELSLVKNKFVRLIVDNKTDNKKFEKFLEKLNFNEPYEVTIIEASLMNFNDSSEDDISTKDTLDILLDYVENVDTTVDKIVLVKEVRSLYLEAINYNENLIGK